MLVPVVPASPGQAPLLPALPFLAVSLETHHLPTSSCPDLVKVLPGWRQTDPLLVFPQDLAILGSVFWDTSCFPDFVSTPFTFPHCC